MGYYLSQKPAFKNRICMQPIRWLNIVVPLPFWQQTVEYLIRFKNLTSTLTLFNSENFGK
jgi:hypothetical protein